MSASPVRVGIDLVQVSRLAESMDHFGDRFLQRVFTAAELRDCAGAPARRTERLAARFAAKEAAMKVLRPGDQALPWRSIEVRQVEGGWCELSLHREAAALARAARLGALAVSLTHEGDYAAAVVTAAEERDAT